VDQAGAPGSAAIMRELFDTFYTLSRHAHPFYEAVKDKVPAQFRRSPTCRTACRGIQAGSAKP